jgi:TonB-linked SusC/RagA family outer membrane protein
MRRPRRAPGAASALPRPNAAAVALAALGLFPVLPAVVAPGGAAHAQAPAAQDVVAGVVTAASSQRPVADAQVTVEGTALGATTDASGRFRIAGVGPGELRLVVRRIGFQPRTVAARAGRPVQVALADRVLELNQVVVTGTAGASERRAVGNAVTQVRAAEVVATQPVRNFQDLLTGRASGVSVIASSGQVGTGARIRVRGASSLSLVNDPLIYVDGIRVDNTQATGPTVQGFGSASVSRFNDFNPDDIESLEVIKGPAAATLYGTEASNGVINIITKRGAAGRTTWNAVGRAGGNWLPNWRNRFFTNYGVLPLAQRATPTDSLGTITVRQLNDSLQAQYGEDIFRTGRQANLDMNVSGGTPALRYYLALGRDDEQGVERYNRLNRTQFRANLTAAPSPRVEVASSVGYTTGRTYLPFEAGGGGATWATFFSSPSFLYRNNQPNNPQLGFRSGPPDVYYTAYDNFQDATRFTSAVTLTHRPGGFFDHRLIAGVDRAIEDNQSRTPRNDPLAASFPAFTGVGGANEGGLTIGTRDVNTVSLDYVGNLKYGIAGGVRGVTSAGGQFYGRRFQLRQASGNGFPAAGLLALSSAAVTSQGIDDVFDNNTLGGFVQQQVVWNDRLFLTAAVRQDDNSSFGANYPAIRYPKFAVSYVASEEPALRLPASVVNSLRLRAAYGGSGLQPGAFDALRTYNAVSGTLTPTNAGNLNLGPERSYETELGLDAGLFDDRLGLELTYFRGTTRDAILTRQAAPSEGFPGIQSFNAGRVDRGGFEWLVRAQPVRGDRLSLDLTVNGSINRYDVRSLGQTSAGPTEFVSVTGQIGHRVGFAPGGWWDRRVVSAAFDTTGTRVPRASMQCDDGKGGTVPCYTGNTLTAPRVFLGSSIPTREGGVTAGLNFMRQFRLNGFIDYRGGYKKLDGNRRVRCNALPTCEEFFFRNRFDPVTIASVQEGTAFTYDLIRDASFARFRELSLTYTLPPQFARAARAGAASLTVAGRNLYLWTNYTGVEPEASFNGGARGAQFGQWEQNVLPQTRAFITTINLTF